MLISRLTGSPNLYGLLQSLAATTAGAVDRKTAQREECWTDKKVEGKVLLNQCFVLIEINVSLFWISMITGPDGLHV